MEAYLQHIFKKYKKVVFRIARYKKENNSEGKKSELQGVKMKFD